MAKDKTFKVKWIVESKRLIKFYESEDAYTIEPTVQLDNIEKDANVLAEVKDNVVISLSIKKEEKTEAVKTEEAPKTAEPKKAVESTKEEKQPEQEKPEEDSVIVEWTLSAMTTKRDVVKFAEQKVEKYWYVVEPSLLPKMQQFNKGDKLKVKIGKVQATSTTGNAYEKDGIIAILGSTPVEVKEDVPEESKKVENKSQSSYSDTNDSIEAQVALKEAGAIVRSFIETNKDTISIDKVEEIIKRLTRVCLETLRNNK